MSKSPNKWIRRVRIALAGIVAVFGLTSCTKSFCTNQDKANQLFAYYGNIYSDNQAIDDSFIDDFDYTDDKTGEYDREKVIKTQNEHRATLYSSISESNNIGSLKIVYLNYRDSKAKAFANDNYHYWTDGTLGKIEDAKQAKAVAYHVGIFAGIDYDVDNVTPVKVSDLWKNRDNWTNDARADSSIGILNSPSSAVLASRKDTRQKVIATNTACITPIGENFVQGHAKIYIEGKTWGQAFKEYGFLEGLFVYPFAYIVHVISEGLGRGGWAQVLAIVVITLITRLLAIASSLRQSKQQNAQQKLQPQLNQLQQLYPEASTDKEQRQQLARDQAQLRKKAKVHPRLPMIVRILQFPVFICVWSALQGSAALASGSIFGLSLTVPYSNCFTKFGATEGAWFGIVLFVFMTIANFLSSRTGLWFTSWKTKNFGSQGPVKKNEDGTIVDPNKTAKYRSIGRMVIMVFMSWSVPVGLGIYWRLGAVISIAQTLIREAVAARSRHNDRKNTGDGSTLAAIRRSAHHQGSKKKEKKSSEKPLWRK